MKLLHAIPRTLFPGVFALGLAACSGAEAPPAESSPAPAPPPVSSQDPAPPPTSEALTQAADETPLTEASSVVPAATNRSILSSDVENLEIPSLCEHQAARLEGGKLPEAAVVDRGSGAIDYRPDGSPLMAVADLNGDGRDELAVSYNCDMGGVAWPSHLLIYDNDLQLITALTPQDLGFDDYRMARGPFDEVVSNRENISLVYHVLAPSDAEAGPGVEAHRHLTLDGDTPQFELVSIRDQQGNPL